VTVTNPTKLAFSAPDIQQSQHCCAPGLHKTEPEFHKQSCTARIPAQYTVLHELLLCCFFIACNVLISHQLLGQRRHVHVSLKVRLS